MKTSQNWLKYFGERVMYWQEKLSLMGWSIEIYLIKLPSDALASCSIEFRKRSAAVSLTKDPRFAWSKKEIDRVAFHEVCEILLAQLGVMSSMLIKEDEVEEAVHTVIRTLENVMVPGCRGKI